MTTSRKRLAAKLVFVGLPLVALFLTLIFHAGSSLDVAAQGAPTPLPDDAAGASTTPVPPRYKDEMNGCLCDCAGKEAGWECNVMGGPRCYYHPEPLDESPSCAKAGGPCVFSGWGCERGGPSATCQDTCFKEVVLKPLCAEAVARFELPEEAGTDPSHLRADRYKLNDDMWKGIELYNYWAVSQEENEAYVTENMGGTIPALTWLFSYEGIAEGVSKRFVFLQDEDRKIAPDKAPAGTEPALWNAIDKFWRTHDKTPLTPKEVFFLALKERKGNAREALLLAHNTLRSLARQGSNALTNVPPMTPEDFNARFEVLRASTGVNDNESSDDSSGLWYHYFGMAFYQVQSRGDQTAVGLMSLSPLVGTDTAKRAQDLMRLMEQLAKKLQGKEKDTRSLDAQALNEAEQIVRQYLQRGENRTPDPEKYCLNLWGADIGSAIYDELPAMPVDWGETIGSFRKGSVETMSDLAVVTKDTLSEYGSKASTSAQETMAEAWDWLTTREAPESPEESRRNISKRHRIVIEGSAADVTWQDAEGENLMLFDQATENLYGYYAVPLFPYYEEDNDTWGIGWISPVDEAHKVVLTGTADDTVHLTVMDPETGQVFEYALDLTTDQTVTVDFPAGEIEPVATSDDGQTIKPKSFELKMEEGEALATSEAGGGFSFTSPLVLGGIAAGLVVVAAAVFVVRRPRPRPAAVDVGAGGPSIATQQPLSVSEPPAGGGAATATVEAPPAAVGGETCACGAVFVAGARFCRQCGATAPPPAVAQTPRCPSCGVEITGDWRFCKSCGARLQ